jgi:bifunctional non-homologous end joining protein LigD
LADKIPFRVTPMLAKLVAKPFNRPGWVYEEKYDGYRILAYKEGKHVELLSRNDKDRTDTFVVVAEAVAKLSAKALLLDGEVVRFDAKKVSRFQLLQSGSSKLFYAVFDCLYRDGRDLRREPLSKRRTELEAAVSGDKSGIIFVSHRLGTDGLKAFELAKKKGYEGLVAKDASSIYTSSRSSYWLKVKTHQEEEFVIAGYTAPEGARLHFGALLLGAYDDGHLRFIGKVGTGFNGESLNMLYKKFQPLVRKTSPFSNPPRERDVTYLEPKLVGQFNFQEWTNDLKLRQPVYLGLRDDKDPHEVKLPAKESA